MAQTTNKTVTKAANPKDAMAAFAAMITSVPEIDNTGSEEDMLLNIINGDSIDTLNRSGGTKLERLVGEDVLIENISRGTSTFKDGLGFFLLVEGVKLSTGEAVQFTTGAKMPVAQLVKAHSMGLLPATVHVTQAPSKSTPGTYYQILTFVDSDDKPGF